MSLKNKENIETNRWQLEIEVDKQDWTDALDRAFVKKGRDITLPGFRKGKAPRHVIEKYYGEGVFFEGAINECYPKAVSDAVEEAGLETVPDEPDLEVVDVSKDGMTFKVKVTTKPDIKIENYKGLKLVKKKAEVTEEDMEAEIHKLLDKYARMEDADRPAQNEDMVLMDFEGFVDGKPFDGGKAENYTLTLGTKVFIPGFEDQVVGHKPGEEFDVNVKFPEDYHEESLKGKDATFKVKIHSLKGKVYPTFDDEFVKDISEKDTVDEVKAELKEVLQARKEKEVEENIDEQITLCLKDLVEGEIPNAMYEAQIDNELRAFNAMLQQKKMDLVTWMRFTGKDRDSLRDDFRETAKTNVLLRLALEKIAQIENLTCTEEEIAEEYDRLAKFYNQKLEHVKTVIRQSGVEKDIISKKAMKLVRDAATVTEEA